MKKSQPYSEKLDCIHKEKKLQDIHEEKTGTYSQREKIGKYSQREKKNWNIFTKKTEIRNEKESRTVLITKRLLGN